MGEKFKKKIKAIKNPNTKFYFLVIMGIGFGIWGKWLLRKVIVAQTACDLAEAVEYWQKHGKGKGAQS